MITNSQLTKTGYFTQTGNNFYQRVGITLTVPIFSGYLNKTNLAKANIGYRQAKLNLQNNQLVLSQQVEQAYLNTSNSLQAYSAANEQLSAATESFRIINEEFKLGGTNIFEVLQLRNQYVQAVQAYTQAKYTAVLQNKIYQFYLGNPITL